VTLAGSTSVTLAVDEKTDNGTDGQTDEQTDRQTDRVRRNMRPPPREEGRITTYKTSCAVTSKLLRGLSFQPTPSINTRRHVFKFH